MFFQQRCSNSSLSSSSSPSSHETILNQELSMLRESVSFVFYKVFQDLDSSKNISSKVDEIFQFSDRTKATLEDIISSNPDAPVWKTSHTQPYNDLGLKDYLAHTHYPKWKEKNIFKTVYYAIYVFHLKHHSLCSRYAVFPSLHDFQLKYRPTFQAIKDARFQGEAQASSTSTHVDMESPAFWEELYQFRNTMHLASLFLPFKMNRDLLCNIACVLTKLPLCIFGSGMRVENLFKREIYLQEGNITPQKYDRSIQHHSSSVVCEEERPDDSVVYYLEDKTSNNLGEGMNDHSDHTAIDQSITNEDDDFDTISLSGSDGWFSPRCGYTPLGDDSIAEVNDNAVLNQKLDALKATVLERTNFDSEQFVIYEIFQSSDRLKAEVEQLLGSNSDTPHWEKLQRQSYHSLRHYPSGHDKTRLNAIYHAISVLHLEHHPWCSEHVIFPTMLCFREKYAPIFQAMKDERLQRKARVKKTIRDLDLQCDSFWDGLYRFRNIMHLAALFIPYHGNRDLLCNIGCLLTNEPFCIFGGGVTIESAFKKEIYQREGSIYPQHRGHSNKSARSNTLTHTSQEPPAKRLRGTSIYDLNRQTPELDSVSSEDSSDESGYDMRMFKR